jgi:protein-disulfide isomerase
MGIQCWKLWQVYYMKFQLHLWQDTVRFFASTTRQWQQIWRSWRRLSWWLAAVLTGVVLVSCSAGGEASENTQTSSEFEQKVLQVVRDNPQVLVETLQAYQQQQKEGVRQARRSFLEKMSKEPATVVGNSPTKGSSKQNIVLLEFSDFQCPFCGRAHDTVKQFIQKHQDRVTLVYKHLPLASIHPQAMPAAQASWAAQQQGEFWKYHDRLFDNQDQLGEQLYEQIASDLGLDMDKFNRDRNSDAAKQAIQKDLQLAQRLGLNSTPFFFLNEQALSGAVKLSELEQALERVDS